MSELLLHKVTEHYPRHDKDYIISGFPLGKSFIINFLKKQDSKCVFINENQMLFTSYFVGIDWLNPENAIYVEPKINPNSAYETNYLEMLFAALKHPEIEKYTTELYEIKFDKPYIEIDQKQDLLTPLLVVQFLRVVKEIVRKGLKKSYYKVDQNLFGRVKGKIIVSQTIKQNILRNKPLYTQCRYDEFGLNGIENRLIKKALIFVRNYLPSIINTHSEKFTSDVLNYIMPSFECVSGEINLNELKHTKTNVFYKEYKEGIQLAKLILQRFGYNISNTQTQTIKTPPFWIDMSKLFELYVLSLLIDRFGKDVVYHPYYSGNELDFLLNFKDNKMVIDAKYRPLYKYSYDISDIRQISGYARLTGVYKHLNKTAEMNIDCLIIYPDQEKGYDHLLNLNNIKEYPIPQFVNFFKIPIKLPMIESK